MRLLLHVKKEIKKQITMLPFLLHFYFIHQTMKTQSQCKRSYTLTFIGPGLFDTGDDWLRMMGVMPKDYMHLKGENKHFLNIFNDFLIFNEAFLRRARDLTSLLVLFLLRVIYRVNYLPFDHHHRCVCIMILRKRKRAKVIKTTYCKGLTVLNVIHFKKNCR